MIATAAALATGLLLATPATAEPGDNPCELAVSFLCQFVPLAPGLDHDVDLTQQQPPADPNAPAAGFASGRRPVRGGLYLEPGVLGGGGEERLQVVAPLGRRGLVRFDAGVVAAIEQQRPRLDLGCPSDSDCTAPNTTK